MTTRRLRSEEGIALRSNRKLPPPPPPPPRQKIPSTIPSPQTPQNSIQNLQEIVPKIERESTTPQGETKERERPLTRSRANSIHRPSNTPIIMGNVSIPPEQICIKNQEFLFQKEEKDVPSPINLPTQDLTPQDTLPLGQTTKKIMTKPHPQLEPTPSPSPYTEIRKSYRKSNKKQILAFPYRKCHDPLQGRITGVLNKLTGERQCKKEMEGLVDRLPKAGTKDIRNKYFVAGVRMVLRMAKERQKQGTAIDARVLSRLQNEEKALQARISQQLSDFSQWIDNPSPSPLQDSPSSSYHTLVMKKLYSIMKRSHPGKKCEDIKRRVVTQCRGFFAGEVSISEMVKFLRKRMEI